MLPTDEEIEALHRKYAPNELVFNLVYGHCQIVCEIAEWCRQNIVEEPVDLPLLRAACLLHDIGSYAFFDDDGKVANMRMYRQHAILGAKIVADEDLDPRVAAAVETHVGLGLSEAEIRAHNFPLPYRDYLPTTLEAELVGYADRFHSKVPIFNSYKKVHKEYTQKLPEQARKLELWSKRFGVPDVPALAQKYKQEIV